MYLILVIKALFRDLIFGLIFFKDKLVDYLDTDHDLGYPRALREAVGSDTLTNHRPWTNKSKGLYCFFNGLNSHPRVFKRQISMVPKGYDIYAPLIPARQPLLTVSEPILEIIKTYTAQYPNNPITLFGLSNGTRISLWVEIQLRTVFPTNPVSVSNIAGVHRGTKNMNLLKKIYDTLNVHNNLLRYIFPYYHPKLMEELVWDSDLSKELMKALYARHSHVRSYSFFGSDHDVTIPEIESSIPISIRDTMGNKLSGDIYLHPVVGEGHNSIVSCVYEHQMLSCNDWMERHSS